MTSADHSQGDCIAAMRKRIAKLEQENARLAANMLEMVAWPIAGPINTYTVSTGAVAASGKDVFYFSDIETLDFDAPQGSYTGGS